MPFPSDRQEFWQSCEVAGRHGHRELRANPVEAAVNNMRHAAHGLGPAEGFLDLLPAPVKTETGPLDCGRSARLAMGLGKEGFKTRHLGVGQPKQSRLFTARYSDPESRHRKEINVF